MNRSKLQVFYSVAVLVVVPALLVFNTILLTTSIRDDLDNELQTRAELANSVLALSVGEYIVTGEADKAQQKIDQLAASQNELKNTAVIVRSSNEYVAVAAANEEYEISSLDGLQYDIVFSRKRPVAKNVAARTDSGQATRAWNVATPVINTDGEVIGIVVSDLLTTDVDEKIDSTITRSILVMIASAVAVLVLLFNHFRFIGYASLLRKQKELNQTMSDFLSVATHELKAPMTIIKGYISNVVEGDHGEVSDDAKEQLGVAVAQTERLNELVQDLLNVSRIEQGKLQFNIVPVNVNKVIQTIVSMYEKPAAEKGLTIHYVEKEDHWVQADAGRVQEIFTNLIDNAVKYSLKGEVVITHTVDGKNVTTAVRDTGIGMSADERARLFQRFYRVKNENTKNISGTGLGLWIIKQYIDKMGGRIQVDSLVGSGTEFQVSLKKSAPPPDKPQ